MAKNLGLLALALVWTASRSNAGAITTVPPGLAPGSQYRLVFVTADTYAAISANISDYNNEVNTEANAVPALAALGATWADIGSTATVNAIDNIGIDSGIPIYNLEGNLVANDAGTESGGLFSYTTSLVNPIAFTEGGIAPPSVYVWTGSNALGNNDTGGECLGCYTEVKVGYYPETNQSWIDYDSGDASGLLELYAISGVLTVPTPEPSAMGMAMGAGALMFLAKRRNRRATRQL